MFVSHAAIQVFPLFSRVEVFSIGVPFRVQDALTKLTRDDADEQLRTRITPNDDGTRLLFPGVILQKDSAMSRINTENICQIHAYQQQSL